MNQITSDILDFIILYESPISLFYTLSLIYIFFYIMVMTCPSLYLSLIRLYINLTV